MPKYWLWQIFTMYVVCVEPMQWNYDSINLALKNKNPEIAKLSQDIGGFTKSHLGFRRLYFLSISFVVKVLNAQAICVSRRLKHRSEDTNSHPWSPNFLLPVPCSSSEMTASKNLGSTWFCGAELLLPSFRQHNVVEETNTCWAEELRFQG